MYRDAICHPLYREEDTLFCIENTISPPYGEGAGHSHAIRGAQTDGRIPQVKRSLYNRENVFSRQRRECPSGVCRGESVSIL